MEDEEQLRLMDTAIRQKSNRAKKEQAKSMFETYCADIRPWAQELAAQVKREGRIGLHPFMAADAYSSREDRTAAVLMSALVPTEQDGLMERVATLRQLMGGSPADFVGGAWKVKDYDLYYRGIGCGRSRLQEWTKIVGMAMDDEDVAGALRYYIRMEMGDVGKKMEDSLQEALFWLSESVLGEDGEKVPVPWTKSTRQFVRWLVPRYKVLGFEESVARFRFDYPAMVFYAAEGRNRLYEESYGAIWRLEHNLQWKLRHGTQMDSYERWRFRSTVVAEVRLAEM